MEAGRRRLMAAMGVAAAATALLPAAAGAAFAPCEKGSRVLCDSVRVPLDRTAAVAGSVKLAVAKVPAKRGPVRGTVMFVTGGPGQGAIDGLSAIAGLLRPRLPGYDFLAFDQRGTGDSGPLTCPSLQRPTGTETRVFTACGRELGARRQFYRTQDSVADLESIRLALGGPSLTLIGVSSRQGRLPIRRGGERAARGVGEHRRRDRGAAPARCGAAARARSRAPVAGARRGSARSS